MIHTDIPTNGVRNLYGEVSLLGDKSFRVTLNGTDSFGNALSFTHEFGLLRKKLRMISCNQRHH